jgi:hypothetical protein
VTEEAILKAAMQAGCDEAERLGYGSTLGYAEAASIAEKAALAVLAFQPEEVIAAARAVVETHAAIIHAVTPRHPDFLYTHGSNERAEDRERYDALFSRWHATTRALGAALAKLPHPLPHDPTPSPANHAVEP